MIKFKASEEMKEAMGKAKPAVPAVPPPPPPLMVEEEEEEAQAIKCRKL